MEFNKIMADRGNLEEEKSDKRETVLEITDYKSDTFKAMLEFLYLGQTQVFSKDLIEILYLCEEYILPSLK